ncbi:hypothetical protein CV102_22670 [Natronococcus pandeyae]|uniref:Glycosyltransferase n=1 Tax=Natronococcus pandeyae TaxID=2055836 RepID=A0A8J8TQ15_9EURY|nr:glycosyltransferase family 4 protein [Natronococcus pandeyae]TYL36430.1 hypothetical protein CV102_22670 [Natronococcus pandeyae]
MTSRQTTRTDSDPGVRRGGSGLDVLFCADYLPPSDGGVEHVVDGLARRLSARGYAVGVFTLAADDESIDLCNHPDVSVFAARKIELTDYIGLQSAISPAAVRRFKRVLGETNPSIVHVHNRFFFTSYLALAYKHYSGYSLVTTLHLGELDHLDGLGGGAAKLFQRTLARQLVTRSDAIVCVSDAVGSVARELGSPPDRTRVLRNAVDLEAFDVAPSAFDKTLLYVGRQVRNNGPQDLIAAAPAVADRHPDASIHLVGGGPLEDELTARAVTLGVDDVVHVHGFVDDVTEYYLDADVFCRPSYSEGLPLTLLESMATYTVPVVTPVAGSREILANGSTGRFVPVGDPDAIAETIADLFDRPETVEHVSRRARAYVEENHSWEQRTDDMIGIYEELGMKPSAAATARSRRKSQTSATRSDGGNQ